MWTCNYVQQVNAKTFNKLTIVNWKVQLIVVTYNLSEKLFSLWCDFKCLELVYFVSQLQLV